MPLSARLALAQGDPLPSWNDGANKQSILDFVAAVTKQGSPDFVPVPQRIATFDNDGTLWCEQPMYVQLAFALERVKALSNQHPEWKTKQPFKAVLDSDIAALAKSGEKGLLELVMATHAGMTTEEFTTIASDWIKTARHPKFKRPYTDLVYQPMLELLTYLRANGFKTFIVSGGGIEFMRPWTEQIYGIPPDQVVGSSIKTKFQMRDGQPELFRLPAIDFVDDGPGKPVGINAHIGQRPIAAFGNSDGDIQMLQWATKSGGRRLGLIVHHTDAEREYAYDRKSHFGKLDKGFDAAKVNGWTLVSMKDDWKRMFKFR
jgi:phosphoglycolate phosphatase-like HAD superfamily hydrolase